MHVDLLLTDFCWPETIAGGLHFPHANTLSTLLNSLKRQAGRFASDTAAPLWQQRHLASEHWRGLFAGQARIDATVPWLVAPTNALLYRVDLLRLDVQRNQLISKPFDQTQLSAEILQTLINDLNSEFAELGQFWRWQNYWFFLSTVLGEASAPFAEIIYRPVQQFMPSVSANPMLAKLWNDAQIFLHNHAALDNINEAQRPNSLWFSGVSLPPDTTTSTTKYYDHIIAQTPALLNGGKTSMQLPGLIGDDNTSDDTLASLLGKAAQALSQAFDNTDIHSLLLELNIFNAALRRGQINQWERQLDQFSASIVPVLLSALASGRIKTLRLLAESDQQLLIFSSQKTNILSTIWQKLGGKASNTQTLSSLLSLSQS